VAIGCKVDQKEPLGAKEKEVGGEVTKGRELAGEPMEVGREVIYA
jgi:hypothetical protein